MSRRSRSTDPVEEDSEHTWLLANGADDAKESIVKRRTRRSFFGVMFAYGTIKDKISVVLAIVAIFIQTLIPPLLMMALGELTNIFSRHQMARTTTDLNSSTITNATEASQEQLSKETLSFAWMSLIVTLITFIAAFAQKYQWELVATRQEHRIRRRFMAQVLKLDIAWIEKHKASSIASMLHDHIERVYEAIADHIPMTVFILSSVTLSFVVALHVQWDIALVMMVAAPIFVILRFIYSWLFAKYMRVEQEYLSAANGLISETFQCIRTVIAFSGQRNAIEKYRRLIDQCRESASKRNRMSAFFEALIWFLMDVVYLCGMCYGVVHLSGSREIGTLVGVLIIMTSVFATLMGIGTHINGTLTGRTRARELQAVLDVVPEIDGDFNRGDKFSTCQGVIRLDNVSFAYPSRPDYQVLDNLSLTVTQGEHVALVGPSGSGKSTIAALLLRLYDPDSGTIYLDNRPIRSLNVDWMRQHFGYVSQEPVLFDETISINVRCGKLLATDAEIEAALEKANALEYIRSLPLGLETRVGERGAQLSGGQKQRVAIARAMIRKPVVLIFDEATSALDSEHEAMVQAAIEKVSVGISSLTIAHRLATVQKCDRVIVLERGRIIEMGSPSELMNARGVFYRMTQEQAIAEAPQGLAGDLSQMGTATSGTDLDLELPLALRQRRKSTSYAAKIDPHPQGDFNSDAEAADMTMRRNRRVDRDGFFQGINVLEISDTIPEGNETIAPVKAKQKSSFWMILPLYRDGYCQLVLGILGCVLKAIGFLMWPLMLVVVIESISTANKKFTHLISLWFLILIIRCMAEYEASYLLAEFGSGLVTRLKGALFHQLLRHQVGYFDEARNSAAHMSSRLNTDTGNVRKLMSDKTERMITDLLTSLLGFIISIYFSPLFSLACCYQLPIMIGARVIEVRANMRRQTKVMPVEENAHKLASIALSHMATIKAYSLQHQLFQMYNAALLPVEEFARRQQSRISALVYGLQSSLSFFIYMVTFVVGSYFIESGYLAPFDFLRVLLLSQMGNTRLAMAVTSVNDIVRSLVSSTTLVDLLQEEVVVDNLSDAGVTPAEFEGNVRLNKVRFHYPTRPQINVLNDLSMKVRGGKTIALVGPSGSGKSTIIQLVQRLYDPTAGRITINGIDLRDYNLSYLRRKIVPVSQEPTLFDCTIWENIAYGLDPIEATQDRITNAAKLANIHDFIMTLPQGYNQQCGEFGTQLSGGQKQRIAIARALIRNPSILLLDEATAALDTASEKSVQLALEAASRRCTCIVIAHRLSTIQNADEIYVIVGGQIIERGNHNQLLQREGVYFNMCHRQIA